MLTLKGKKPYKRNGSYYFTLIVINDSEDTLVADGEHKWLVRPRLIQKDDVVVRDPNIGRSQPLEITPGGNTVKIRISEKDLKELDGSGDYTVAFGIVHELKQWHLPLYDTVLSVE